MSNMLGEHETLMLPEDRVELQSAGLSKMHPWPSAFLV